MSATAAKPEGRSSGILQLESVSRDEAEELGEEAKDLALLSIWGVPVAPGWLVRLGEGAADRLEQAIHMALEQGPCARLRPVFPSHSGSLRSESALGVPRDACKPAEAHARVIEALEKVSVPEVVAKLGGSTAAMHFRVAVCDGSPGGRAASADPIHGDPDELSVWSQNAPAARWRIDRRTMRITEAGEQLEVDDAAAVADLADRAQLVLGHPVEIEWSVHRGRFVIACARRLKLRPDFGQGSWRRVALMAADEGTVAPLAIDCLDKALGRDDERVDEPRVRRIYARPYRRIEPSGAASSRGSPPPSLPRASAQAARVTRSAVAPLAAARTFQQTLPARLSELDATDMRQLDDDALVQTLRQRQRLVGEALVLLDRARETTRAVLAALEAVLGTLPREHLRAIANPKRSRSRQRVHERLQRFARRIEAQQGRIVGRANMPAGLQREWDELRSALADVRPLGIDVRPDAFGASDEYLLDALQRAHTFDDAAVERARREAVRRLRATTKARASGRAREALAWPLLALASRVARTKGNVAEALAETWLRLRRAAREAGRRMVETGILDAPDDALYLHLSEIEEALSGEPGAYAARARLRYEDDARWAEFDAPRRIMAPKW